MAANMDPLFEASNLKVERARRHLRELECVLSKHARKHPPKAEFIEAADNQPARINMITKSPPKVVGAIVGDIVHNLRAALDLMAVELVSLVPNANTKGVYFPFAEDVHGLPKQIKDKNFHRAGQDAVDLLKTLRPYKGGNIALRAVHDLDVQDKHHTLIPNAATMTTPEVTVDASAFPKIKIVPVPGSVGSVKEVFPNDSPLAGSEMVPALHDLVKLVEGILESFTRLVAART